MKITDLFKHAKRQDRFSKFVQTLSDDDLRSLIKERGWKLGRQKRWKRLRWESLVENLLIEIHNNIYTNSCKDCVLYNLCHIRDTLKYHDFIDDTFWCNRFE